MEKEQIIENMSRRNILTYNGPPTTTHYELQLGSYLSHLRGMLLIFYLLLRWLRI